jgi:exosortase
MRTTDYIRRSHLLFISWVALSLALLWAPLLELGRLSMHNDQYSHTILIPLASGLLVYVERERIFTEIDKSGRALGGILALAAMALYVVSGLHLIPLSSADYISAMVLSLVFAWIGGFVVCYGVRAFRSAAFPLLFLFLMIPIPGFLLERMILALQHGSAATAYVIFRLARVPVYRSGLVFSLPGLNIEIAKECSGIRSSMALLITALLASHFFLSAYWKKAFLVAFIVPLVVLKNALRISTLSLLSIYVNRGFLSGNLHRYGGIPFSIVSVGILIPVLWRLQKSDARPGSPVRGETPELMEKV